MKNRSDRPSQNLIIAMAERPNARRGEKVRDVHQGQGIATPYKDRLYARIGCVFQAFEACNRGESLYGYKGTKCLKGSLARTWRSENHRLMLALHVKKHRNVTVTTPGGGLIHADCGDT